jgi:C4-dicarboxylate transporter DctM subunit
MFIALIFGTFLFITIIGAPISIALVMGAIVPLFFLTANDLSIIIQRFFNAVNVYSLLAIPLFVFSGALLDRGGASKRLVRFANSIVGWMPGGLAIVAFLASAFFGAISGSSLATVAAIGSILVPAMQKEGYPLNFSLATVASAGWLGVIIPPSIPMILYATAGGGISVGDLFLGGFIPGIILAIGMSLYGFYYGKFYMKNKKKFSLKELRASFIDAIWALGMPLIILGGIYGGIFTPTEAAAVACAYGAFAGFILYKELTFAIFRKILNNSVVSTSFIMFVVAAATAFGYVLTLETIPTKIANYIISVASGPGSFLGLVTVLLLIVGTFMDTAPAVLILSPILVPVLATYNVNPVAFGVILVINLGIGMVTPPVGMNLYVAASLKKVPVSIVINRHLFFYMVIAFLIMVLYMIFPDIILFLPKLLAEN